MLKILNLVSVAAVLSASPISLYFTKNLEVSTQQQFKSDPSWVSRMSSSTNSYELGYQDRKLNFYQSAIDNIDWLNMSTNHNLYIYLKGVTSLATAAKRITLNDTARLEEEYGFKGDVLHWQKSSTTQAYINTAYITQDTTVGGIGLLSNNKYTSILNNNNFKTKLSVSNINFYKEYNSVKSAPQAIKNSWWDSGQWETLLKNNSDFQYDYKLWKTSQVGMNVPLSYIEPGCVSLTTTGTASVFHISINLHEAQPGGGSHSFTTPHWGLGFKLTTGSGSVLFSHQLVTSFATLNKSASVLAYLKSDGLKSFDQNINKYPKI